MVQTDFGKGYSFAAYRRCEPASSTVGVYGLEQSAGTDALWILLLNQTYFAAGGNPNNTHALLSDLEASVSGCVFGYNSHLTAAPWYTGNAILQNGALPAPNFAVAGQATMALPPGIVITTQAAATYPMNCGGFAICSTNTAAAANKVHVIEPWVGGAINITGALATISLSGGNWRYNEPA